MYKVFINDKSVQLFKNINKTKFSKRDKVLKFQEIKSLSHEIENLTSSSKIDNLYIYNPEDVEKLLKQFLSNYIIVSAAGGIVLNEKNEILFILRKGKWDLPKGKAETGESMIDTAIREVEEETGLTNLQISEGPMYTYHIYEEKGLQILKKTFWYQMKCQGEQKLKPEEEEEITAVEWFRKKEIGKVLSNTYRSIRELLYDAKII